MTAKGVGRVGGGGIEQKGKGFMVMDNSVVIVGGGIWGINGNGRKPNKNLKKVN